MKFRKKPIVIEAANFTRQTFDFVKEFTNDTAHSLKIERRIDGKCTCIIPTLEGEHIATEGDWIIKGVHGEFYPCKPDIFVKTYEPEDDLGTGMEEILNEAQRRKAKYSVQYVDYSLDTWTVASDLLEHRKKDLLADGSVRKVRIEYEM